MAERRQFIEYHEYDDVIDKSVRTVHQVHIMAPSQTRLNIINMASVVQEIESAYLS